MILCRNPHQILKSGSMQSSLLLVLGFFFFFFLFLCIPLTTQASIAFDSVTQPQAITDTTLTFSHTVTGANPVLLVSCSDKSAASSVITGVTYDSVAATLADGERVPGDRYITEWVVAVPNTGTHDVVVSASETVSLRCSAISYTGVDDDAPYSSAISDTFTAVTDISIEQTPSTSTQWMTIFQKDDAGGTDYTFLSASARVDSDAGGHAFGDDVADASPHTISLTSAVSANHAAISLLLNEFSDAVDPGETPTSTISSVELLDAAQVIALGMSLLCLISFFCLAYYSTYVS